MNMTYEEETEYSTTHYRCIDPIENFKIKVIVQPYKNLYIPLPQFDAEQPSPDVSASHEENQSEVVEYTFKWQEKIFSRNEIKKYCNEEDWKKKLFEKYHGSIRDGLNNLTNYQNKLFSYVAADNYSVPENELNLFAENTNFISSLSHKINNLSLNGPSFKHFKNVPKRKVVNYYPSDEFKIQAHLINKNVQKMFIMIDLGSKLMDSQESEDDDHFEGVLCSLSYNYSTSVLEITPSFSKSEIRPYTIGIQNKNGRSFYYYWIYHASSSIKSENLSKEIQLMSKVFDYQELKKLQIDTEFFVGKPNHIYTTLLGEIVNAKDFEFDDLHVHYFIKLHPGWGYSDIESLIGRTQTCRKNSFGICHFSHLFEMNFCLEINSFDDPLGAPLEIFFEVLSVDKYKRYRNEGYTYISIPNRPGMHKFNLRCWRISDGTIKSQLERFFIGGGPELEDISYVGLSVDENPEIMSRFGLETIPSGVIEVKLNILHQSKNYSQKKYDKTESEKSVSGRLDAGSLLGSVNAVLEAFRKARERMLKAKKGLKINLSYPPSEMKENKKVD